MNDGTFPATDKWRLYVESLPEDPADPGAMPDALINLEVVIRRRIVIPSHNNIDELDYRLRELGLKDVSAIIDAAKKLTPRQRRYVSADWTDALGGQFDNDHLAALMRITSGTMTWRVEEDPSPKEVMYGVISCDGYELRQAMTKDNIESLKKTWMERETEAALIENDAARTPEERAAARVTLAVAACFLGPAAIAGAARVGGAILWSLARWAAKKLAKEGVDEIGEHLDKRRESDKFDGNGSDFRRVAPGLMQG